MDEDKAEARLTSVDSLPRGKPDNLTQTKTKSSTSIIHRVETETASIKFTGNLITGLSDSENEFSSSPEVDYMIKDIDFNKKVDIVTEWDDGLEIVAERQTDAEKETDRYLSFSDDKGTQQGSVLYAYILILYCCKIVFSHSIYTL